MSPLECESAGLPGELNLEWIKLPVRFTRRESVGSSHQLDLKGTQVEATSGETGDSHKQIHQISVCTPEFCSNPQALGKPSGIAQ